MKTVEIKTNSNGIKYGLVAIHTNLSADADDCTYAVYKLFENYNGKVRGGISKTWRYVEKNLPFEDAYKLCTRRTK
jgi:hypothetical protein